MSAPEDNPADDLKHQEPMASFSTFSGPITHEEAQQFHQGFLAGATAYCAAIGHSCLKSDNPKLREVFDAQGWRTIETFERLNHVCEHGVKDGDWCELCNRECKRAAAVKQSYDDLAASGGIVDAP
jgi:hypothetical protein